MGYASKLAVVLVAFVFFAAICSGCDGGVTTHARIAAEFSGNYVTGPLSVGISPALKDHVKKNEAYTFFMDRYQTIVLDVPFDIVPSYEGMVRMPRAQYGPWAALNEAKTSDGELVALLDCIRTRDHFTLQFKDAGGNPVSPDVHPDLAGVTDIVFTFQDSPAEKITHHIVDPANLRDFKAAGSVETPRP